MWGSLTADVQPDPSLVKHLCVGLIAWWRWWQAGIIVAVSCNCMATFLKLIKLSWENRCKRSWKSAVAEDMSHGFVNCNTSAWKEARVVEGGIRIIL